MKPWSFYEHWLDLVSRSFALCIPQLEPPFRDQVALAYLLFRVLDTIEDAPFTDPVVQQRQFARLCEFLREMPARSELAAFVAHFPAQLSDGERALLGDTGALLEEGHALPADAREVMFGAIDRMAIGMAAYMRRPPPLRLVDVEDVARYCCFVAGIVGEMLTDLWTIARGTPGPSRALAYHFGLFLQKVNILKDQMEDKAAGRFLVPDRRELLGSLRADAEGALRYLQALPRGDSYRVFCAWSLMLGATTIAHLDEPRQSRRDETVRLLAQTTQIANDNVALGLQLAELMPALPDTTARAHPEKPESFAWFRAALAAPLTESDLRRLGVVGARAIGRGPRRG